MFALTLSRVDAEKSEEEEEKGGHDGEQMLIKKDKNARMRNTRGRVEVKLKVLQVRLQAD